MHRELPVFASTCSASNERCWRSRSASDIFTLLIPLLVLGGVCTRAQRQSHPDEIGLSLPRDADMKLDESVSMSVCSHGRRPFLLLTYDVELYSRKPIQNAMCAQVSQYATYEKVCGSECPCMCWHTSALTHQPYSQGAGTLFVYISQPMEMLSALAAYKVHILASTRVTQENLSEETHEIVQHFVKSDLVEGFLQVLLVRMLMLLISPAAVAAASCGEFVSCTSFQLGCMFIKRSCKGL